MADWYAVQTKARQEAVAELHLGNQSFRTFLPLLRTHRHRRGRWQAVTEPLFPGYLFVELDIERHNTAPIRSTRGVIGLVRQGLRPQAVPHDFVDGLIQLHAKGGKAIEPEKVFRAGDAVMLIDGPMAGLRAVFHAQSSRERVVVLLEMLGGSVMASVSPHQLAFAS